jgi:hypothetical protein
METPPPSRRSGPTAPAKSTSRPDAGESGARAPSSPDAGPRSTRLSSGLASEPRLAATRPIDESGDRAPRVQLVAALLLLLVLVVVPLYLWRRPRATDGEGPAATGSSTPVSVPIAAGGDAGASGDGGDPGVTVGEVKMLECHDPGSKKTAPADCDRLPLFEHAVTDAIRAEASCGTGAGEVLWVVDVSTLRKKTPVLVTVTKDGHALKSGKVATDCTTALKRALAGAVVDKTHAHARYKMEVTASYR